MGLREDLAADYAAVIPDYDQTFSWGNRSYPCTRTTAVAGMMLVNGGEEISVSDRITVSLPLTDVDGDVSRTRPKYGDLIDGNRLQVVKLDPNVGHLVVWCAPPMNVGGGGGMSME